MSTASEKPSEKESTRREALASLAKAAAYIAPATLVVLSSKDGFAYP